MRIFDLLRCGFVLGALLLPLSTAAAQEQPTDQLLLVNVDPTALPELEVRFGLIDADGRVVQNLQAPQITATVDGYPLAVMRDPAIETPDPAVVIVADFSTVMNGQDVLGNQRLRVMIEQIDRLLERLSPESPVSLVVLADQTRVEIDWQAGAARVQNTLEALASMPSSRLRQQLRITRLRLPP